VSVVDNGCKIEIMKVINAVLMYKEQFYSCSVVSVMIHLPPPSLPSWQNER
jgi:hypothetical protein